MKGSVRDAGIERFIEKTKEEMKERCRKNIDSINEKCAFGGESFAKHKGCFEASKEFLRYGGFPSCYGKLKEGGEG